MQTGDYVSIDLTASIDGAEIEAGSAKGMSYEVGSGDLVDGLDDALVGTSAGDTVTFAAKLQQGERAGDEADITVAVNSVKEKELPELDDEFAQLASEFDTIDELRDDLRERWARSRSSSRARRPATSSSSNWSTVVEFPVPESAVQAEVDYREHEVVHSLGHDDELFDSYLEREGKSREEFTGELRESAEKAVRAQFLLDAVADKAEVNVGDAELTEYLVRQAARYQMAPQEFASQVMQSGNLPALVADVRRNKALADLLEHAVITDASGNTVDLSALAPNAIADLAASASDDDDDDDAEDIE